MSLIHDDTFLRAAFRDPDRAAARLTAAFAGDGPFADAFRATLPPDTNYALLDALFRDPSFAPDVFASAVHYALSDKPDTAANDNVADTSPDADAFMYDGDAFPRFMIDALRITGYSDCDNHDDIHITLDAVDTAFGDRIAANDASDHACGFGIANNLRIIGRDPIFRDGNDKDWL
ncbi:unnamed protein product [Rotaria magnacalcarata]|uniref:Uncharacterized protein n=1 Tax=Rotaria magnacalcarata TaxID=392030 RepID=A0A816P3H0_9BILA|nr:unnamed protein product [Rotaria magnacalcarata]CAF2084321.1 unnamed protein product [Rotaria magnacalcarata]CAF4216987.1 unnamed protein product [Rotaria magnacalcarata]CAF4243417.1 unnamed protein product [Rotaria magnacalcarata]